MSEGESPLEQSLLKIRLKENLETTQVITLTEFLYFNFNVYYNESRHSIYRWEFLEEQK